MNLPYQIFDIDGYLALVRPERDAHEVLWRSFQNLKQELDVSNATFEVLMRSAARHTEHIVQSHSQRIHHLLAESEKLFDRFRLAQMDQSFISDWNSYWRDASERAVLTLHTLIKRGDHRLPIERKAEA